MNCSRFNVKELKCPKLTYNGRSEVVSALTGGVAANYAYDAVGNRLVSTNGILATAYAANALNQYDSVTADGADTPVEYDRWGNMTRFGAYSYSCTERNNRIGLVSTNRPNGRVENLCRSGCDGLDRRVYKSVYLPSEERHEFYYNGWNPVVEKITPDSGTTETVRYVWGKDLSGSLQGAGGVGGLLATQVGGAWYFPAYDANGNITQYVDEDGHVVASYTYDAFGNTVAESGSMAGVFPFRFSTKYYDSESGLYYYGYRYYSPGLERWLTRDPIEEAGGVNLYGFCGNNGVGKVDVLGLTVDVSKFKNYGSLKRPQYIHAYAKTGRKGSGALETYGFTLALITMRLDVEQCENSPCYKLVLSQDVAVEGSMAWRIYEDAITPEGKIVYLKDIEYRGASGRTAREHEMLHYSYALGAAKKLDEKVHEVIDGKGYNRACVHEKHTNLYTLKDYFNHERLLNDAQLELSDYNEEDKAGILAEIGELTTKLEELRLSLQEVEKRMEKECSK